MSTLKVLGLYRYLCVFVDFKVPCFLQKIRVKGLIHIFGILWNFEEIALKQEVERF